MTILAIMLVQAVPVYIVARIFKSGVFVTLSAIIMAALALATGGSAYALVDLFGIGIAYWLGMAHVNSIATKLESWRQNHSRTSPENLSSSEPDSEFHRNAATSPQPDDSLVEFRHEILGAADEAIHEQLAVLLAAMNVHLALEAAGQFGSIANQTKDEQEKWINGMIIKGLERNQFQPTFLRRRFTRYVFDLYREAYITVANLLPPWERQLSMVQYKMAVTAADFLKSQFLKEGRADICTFLEVTTRARKV